MVIKFEKYRLFRLGFRIYAKIRGIRIEHTKESVNFYLKGEKVAEREMINGFKPGKFRKLNKKNE